MRIFKRLTSLITAFAVSSSFMLPFSSVTAAVSHGDVSLDGSVNYADAGSLAKNLLGKSVLSQNAFVQADVDGSLTVTAADLALLKRYAIGEITSFPADGIPGDQNTLYVSPSGNGLGTYENPMGFTNALTAIPPGGTIYMLAGTYSYSDVIKIQETNNGTQGNPKTVKAYNDARVVLDFSTQSYDSSDTSKNARGLQLEGDYWHFYGIRFYGAADNGLYVCGNYNTIEMCVFEANRDSGLQISRANSSQSSIADWPSYNLIKNCTSFNNMDPATGENADGFAAKLTCGPGNVFDGCIAYNNVDDGWDCYAKSETGPIGVVTIKNCISFRNGQTSAGVYTPDSDGNGFKLGGGGVGTAHIINNCIAFENKKHGFTDNNNPLFSSASNLTAYNNGAGDSGSNLKFDRVNGAVYANLLSYMSNQSDKMIGTISNSVYYNSKQYWLVNSSSAIGNNKIGTNATISASDFVNLSSPPLGADVHILWRNPDGSITTKGFLMAASSSAYYTMGAKFAYDGGGEVVTTTPEVTSPPVSETTPASSSDGTGSSTAEFGLVGYGAGTTGGQGGKTVTCSTAADIISALSAKDKSTPLIIYVNGKGTLSNAGGNEEILLKDSSDVSIIGVGTKGELEGIGIRLVRCTNVIIQNMKIHHVLAGTGEGDCISIENSSNIWVDHCELYNEYSGNESDKDKYDGLLDCKKDSKNITYSWNYLHDSWKSSLCGFSDSDDYDRTITYHHNIFENINSRLPLFRFGHGHIYNNYYVDIHTSGINSRMGAEVCIENNIFENAKNPVCSMDSKTIGTWNLSGNVFNNCTGSPSSGTNIGWSAGMSSTSSYRPAYSYKLTSTDSLIAILRNGAGVGKIG